MAVWLVGYYFRQHIHHSCKLQKVHCCMELMELYLGHILTAGSFHQDCILLIVCNHFHRHKDMLLLSNLCTYKYCRTGTHRLLEDRNNLTQSNRILRCHRAPLRNHMAIPQSKYHHSSFRSLHLRNPGRTRT